MKNLTRHRLALGVLMAFVLAFGVQGTADALTFKDSKSGDYNVVQIGQSFTITFSLTPGSNTTQIKNTSDQLVSDDGTRINSSGYKVFDDTTNNKVYRLSTAATTLAGNSNVTLVTLNKDEDTTKTDRPPLSTDPNQADTVSGTLYVVDGSGAGAANIVTETGLYVYRRTGAGSATSRYSYSNATAKPDEKLSDAVRYHYNEEAVGINVQRNGADSTDLTLTKSGTSIPSAIGNSALSANPTDTTASLYEGAEHANRRLGSSTTLTGIADDEGKYTITIADITEDSDRPSDASARGSITFTIFVLQNVSDSLSSTIADNGGLSDGIAQQYGTVDLSVTLTGNASTFARVEFEVFRGPGRLYEDKDGDGKADKSPSNKLTTFTNNGGHTSTNAVDSKVDVIFKPNSGTSHIRAWVYGNAPGTDNKSTEAVYVFGFSQLQKVSGHSPEQTGPPSSRLEDPFVAQLVDSTGRTGIPGATITFTIDGGGSLVKDPSFPDDLYDDNFPTNRTVTTNDQGRVSVFLVLGTTGPQAVTAAYGSGLSAKFEASISGTGTGRTPQHIGKLSTTDGQRADQYGVLEKPLTVIVRDQYGDLLPNATVEFETRDGGTLSAPDNTKGEPGSPTSGGDELDRRRDINTNSSGKASVRYTAPAGSARRTVTATLEAGSRSSVTFTINGTGTGDTNQSRTPYLSISPSSLTGSPGESRSFTVSARDANNALRNIQVNLSSSGVTVPSSVNTGQAVSITLPSSSTSISATATGYTSRSLSISVQAAPDEIVKVSGDNQTGEPSASLSSSFVVRVEDSSNNPISGQTVTFQVTGGGGSLSATTGTTDSSGQASTTLTLGSSTGTNTVEASVSGVSSVVTFTATAERASVANRLEIEGGNNQTGELNRLLPSPLSVQLLDQNGDPIQSLTIEFEVTQGTGRLSPRTARTDSSGLAEVNFTPTSTGNIQVRASIRGIDTISPVTFSISGGSPPDALVLVSGNNQSGKPGAKLANPFVVEVIDEDDEPVSGVSVTFAVTAGGGTLSTSSATTGSNGRAQTTLTLGEAIGDNTVVARVSGLTDRVTFKARTGAQVLVDATQRAPMYWISRADGKLHRLIDAEVEALAPNIDSLLSLTVDTQNSLLYWTRQTAERKSAIQRAGLNGKGVITLQTSLTLMTSIAVNSTGTTLYWADILGKIKSRPVQGNRVTLLARNLSSPTGLVWAKDYLYWGEATGHIRRMNLKNNRRTIETVATSTGEPVSLAVHSGRVYWTEISGNASQLNRVNTNGTGLKALKKLGGSRRVWIDVDGSDSKIYLARLTKLERRGLSGGSAKTLVEGLQNPGSLVLGGTVQATPPVVQQSTQSTQPTTQTTYSKYDVNKDGAVNNKDTRLVAGAVGQSGAAITNARADVDGSGTVDVTDLILVIGNLDDDAAAPTLDLDLKAMDLDFDRVQEQVEMLLASGDRSIAAQRALLYLQHLLASARPDETVLLANYPNPFNPETWIPYHLAESTEVKVNIYDAQGTLVRALTLGHQTAGYYTSRSRAAYWDGRNAIGERVASGIYFYQLQTDAISPMRKMVILK